MASSTTIPIANTKPNKVKVLIVNPKGKKNAKVPIIDTGMANTGIKVARQLCKNTNTTIVTNTSASSNVSTTSLIDTSTTETDSKGIL